MKIRKQPYTSRLNALYDEAMASIKPTAPATKKTDKQCASTQAILDRDPSRDAQHRTRAMTTEWLAVKGAQNMDEAVNERIVTREEVSHQESIRSCPKNAIGQGTESSLDQFKKDLAVEAFMEVPGTELVMLSDIDKLRITEYFKEKGLTAPTNLKTQADFIKLMLKAGLVSEADLVLVKK